MDASAPGLQDDGDAAVDISAASAFLSATAIGTAGGLETNVGGQLSLREAGVHTEQSMLERHERVRTPRYGRECSFSPPQETPPV